MRGKQYVQYRAFKTVWLPPLRGKPERHRDSQEGGANEIIDSLELRSTPTNDRPFPANFGRRRRTIAHSDELRSAPTNDRPFPAKFGQRRRTIAHSDELRSAP